MRVTLRELMDVCPGFAMTFELDEVYAVFRQEITADEKRRWYKCVRDGDQDTALFDECDRETVENSLMRNWEELNQNILDDPL